MKSTLKWDQERHSGPANGLRPYSPLSSHPRAQSVRPGAHAASGRWLATIDASLEEVREAVLATFSEMSAELAYLYHADDRLVIRAIHDDHQIRVEVTPLDAGSTRVGVVCTLGGDMDRTMSTHIVRTLVDRLASAHS